MKHESDHPDLAEIDAVRTGEAAPEICAHVESCESCEKHLQFLRSLALGAVDPASAVSRIPEEAHEAVLSLIQRRSAELRWRRPRRAAVFSKPVWAAAAAILVVLLSLVMFSERSVRLHGSGAVALQGDMDGNGMLDVVDAYLMAAQMDAGGADAGCCDQNGDGVVDRRDVDAVMRQVVAVVEEV